jgi:predicted permease
MLRNYLATSIRKFLRHPIYTLINITGLTLGLTCSIFIFLWVTDELSYNRYHKENDRVFKVLENQFSSDGSIVTVDWTSGAFAGALRSDFPEVAHVSRLTWSDTKLFKTGEKTHYEDGNYADGSIFKVLNLSLTEGDLNNPLPDIGSIAISKKMATRYFDHSSALGRNLQLNNNEYVTVTAVFEDRPENTTEKFEFILPMERYFKEEGIDPYRWENQGWLRTFVQLKDPYQLAAMNRKIKGLARKHNPEYRADLFLFPLTDWRLYANFENGKPAGGRISYVISFSLVATFILIIACINFMNLSTARAATRAKEVGVRKAAGASRGALIQQFIAESILLAFFALIAALILVHLFLPAFNGFIRKNLTIDYFDPAISGTLLSITLVTGILAGSYPAFFLSAFRPATVLKSHTSTDLKGASLRKALVVFQFSLSMIIIVCAWVVHEQITYMRNKNLGFDKKNLIMIRSNPEIFRSYEGLRNQLLQRSAITSVAYGATDPMAINGGDGFEWEGKPANDDTFFNMANCDYNYAETFGFTFIAGRNFSRSFPADTANYIITEGAAQKLGFVDPIGRRLWNNSRNGQIIGVIKDFHNLGIRETYQPTILTLGKNDTDFGRWATVFVRYEPGKTDEALASIREIYKANSPGFPIQFSFLDEDYEQQFRMEIMTSTLSSYFTALAIIISCLGLFGLSLFNTERRKKEISIRKVLGASVSHLVVLLCSDFVRLVVYAIFIAYPISYYLSENFLAGYAYHEQLSAWMFVLPAVAMLIIALSIVGYQSAKAARHNPVDAMRSE